MPLIEGKIVQYSRSIRGDTEERRGRVLHSCFVQEGFSLLIQPLQRLTSVEHSLVWVPITKCSDNSICMFSQMDQLDTVKAYYAAVIELKQPEQPMPDQGPFRTETPES